LIIDLLCISVVRFAEIFCFLKVFLGQLPRVFFDASMPDGVGRVISPWDSSSLVYPCIPVGD